LLREKAERTIDDLRGDVGSLIDLPEPTECATSSKPPDTIQNKPGIVRLHPIGATVATPIANGSHDLNPTDKQPTAGLRERRRSVDNWLLSANHRSLDILSIL
jgi:hypothetical protein